jgi:pimeloyl-ACP methyl ester carboxylesterase
VLVLRHGAWAGAQGVVVDVPTRDQVTTTLFWVPTDNARATLLLFPGGDGGFGTVEDGRAGSANFLVRTVPAWQAHGFNVAIFGRSTDLARLGFTQRIGRDHLADVRRVIEHLLRESGVPLWLVATSRGTISAAAAAIQNPTGIAGLVLTASVTDMRRPGALPRQDLAALRLPVLLMHHRADACPICRPQDLPGVLSGLANATPRKLVVVDGGGPPTGEDCGPLHWHGFIGAESEAVNLIADWIRRPTN